MATAFSTSAGRLVARRVIHTVPPRWQGDERELLAATYRAVLACPVTARGPGFEIFSFRIRERPGGALLDQLQVCDDRERFTVADDARALEQAEWLIDWLGSAKAR